jgi:hypothetical protein
MYDDKALSTIKKAALLLAKGVRNGYVNSGNEPPRPKFQFSLVENGKTIAYSALRQNPDTGTIGAELQKAGHMIIVIKNNTANKVVGFFDTTDRMFFPFLGLQPMVDAEDVDALFRDSGFTPDDLSSAHKSVESGERLKINASAAQAVPPVVEKPVENDETKQLLDEAKALVARLEKQVAGKNKPVESDDPQLGRIA